MEIAARIFLFFFFVFLNCINFFYRDGDKRGMTKGAY